MKITSKIIIDKSRHYFCFKFQDTNGNKKRLYPSRSHISTPQFIDDLLNYGIAYDNDKDKSDLKQAVSKCLKKAEKNKNLRVVELFSKPTFVEGVLVTRYGCFGSEEKLGSFGYVTDYQEQILFDYDDVTAALIINNSADDNREAYKPFLESSSSLTIVYLAAIYASIVLMAEEIDGMDLNGFTLVASGKGGRGKTTLCLAGHSITEKAADERILLSLTAGEGHNHDELPSRCGSLVGIGDTKSAQVKGINLLNKLQSYLFLGVEMLARKRKTDPVKLKYNSPLIFLLPIEASFTALHHENSLEVAEGDRRRVVELPINARSKGGIFDLQNSDNSKAFTKKLKDLASKQDGCLMNDWVEAFASLSKNHILSIADECYDESQRKKYWTKRQRGDKLYYLVADNLDHLWLTARLLNKVGQLPVSLKHVAKCLQIVDDQNRRIITGHGDPLQRKVRREIFKLFKNENSFPRLEKGQSLKDKSKKAIGFIREEEDGKYLYILPDGLYSKFPENEKKIVKSCIKSLLNRGFGKKPKDGFTAPVKQEGFGQEGKKKTRPRCWVLYLDGNRKPEKR